MCVRTGGFLLGLVCVTVIAFVVEPAPAFGAGSSCAGKKTAVCHVRTPNDLITLCVSPNAVPDHQGHGDKICACSDVQSLFTDADGDGFGASPVEACPGTPGTSSIAGDCDDTNPSVHPGATESCNGLDDDCDQVVDVGDFAATFDGDGDYIQIARNNTALDMGTGDITIEAWVRISSPFVGRIFSKGSYHCIPGYMVRTAEDSAALGEISGSCESAHGATLLADGAWHQVTAVFDRNATLTLYVDGNFDGSVSIAGSQFTSVANSIHPRIGMHDGSAMGPSDPPEAFDGLIDEVRVWNRALSQAEIQGHMCVPLAGTEAGLVGYWPLERDFDDHSGNANHGTPNGQVVLVPR